MATPTSPADMEIAEWELASDSATSNTSAGTTTPVMMTPGLTTPGPMTPGLVISTSGMMTPGPATSASGMTTPAAVPSTSVMMTPAAVPSTSVLRTPTSLVSMASLGTDEEEEEDSMLTGYGVVTRAVVAIERELHGLDISNGWPQAFLEMADLCHDYPYRAARAWENRARNRYRDVSPYDHSRVHLMVAMPAMGGGYHPGLGLATAAGGGSSSSSSASSSLGDQGGGGDENNDYINANFVVVEEAQRRYILTQGPLPNTSGHFWLMVWQQNSRGVIMLNRLVEKETVKCSQYWPLCQGQVVFFEEVGISVQMLGEEVKPYYEVHYLRLENMMTGESKAVSHFHYTSWPDFGVPESPASFLAFLFMVRESGSLNDEQSTVVIHCSAGIGRSGTFALIDSCLVLLEKRENRFSLNIRQALVNLRKYRMGLIQTPEQLRFSYVAIVEGAKYLMGDQSIRKKWKALTQEDHCRSYSFDSSPPPSGITKKCKALKLVLDEEEEDSDSDSDSDSDDLDDDESDYSDLATRMPDSGEESCETTTRKRSREESKGDSSQEEGHKKDKKSKVPSKRKKPNPPDL